MPIQPPEFLFELMARSTDPHHQYTIWYYSPDFPAEAFWIDPPLPGELGLQIVHHVQAEPLQPFPIYANAFIHHAASRKFRIVQS